MKLGFIGTGEITKAVVTGILNSKIKYKKIYFRSLYGKLGVLVQISNTVFSKT